MYHLTSDRKLLWIEKSTINSRSLEITSWRIKHMLDKARSVQRKWPFHHVQQGWETAGSTGPLPDQNRDSSSLLSMLSKEQMGEADEDSRIRCEKLPAASQSAKPFAKGDEHRGPVQTRQVSCLQAPLHTGCPPSLLLLVSFSPALHPAGSSARLSLSWIGIFPIPSCSICSEPFTLLTGPHVKPKST